jgi:hypothetical protein
MCAGCARITQQILQCEKFNQMTLCLTISIMICWGVLGFFMYSCTCKWRGCTGACGQRLARPRPHCQRPMLARTASHAGMLKTLQYTMVLTLLMMLAARIPTPTQMNQGIPLVALSSLGGGGGA